MLAGGRGSRMGEGKVGLEFGGRTLLEHAVRLVRGWFDEVVIVGEVGEPGRFGEVKVVRDAYRGRGPLGGIHAGLVRAEGERCFVVGCDMPFVEEGLVEMLVSEGERADVVIPRSTDGKLHPLVAVYGKGCLPAIESQLESGRNKITDFFGDVEVSYIEETEWRKADPDGRSFFNINTKQDYRKALAMLEGSKK